MTAVTLPGAILGLLRRGSPVTLRPRVYGDVTLMHGGQGVVHDAARGVAVVDTFGGSPRVVRYGREDVALDLTDPTGRAHAAWYLGGVGASWHLSCDGFRRWEIHGGETPRAGFMLEYEGVGAEHRRMRSRPNIDVTDVTALDHLNPDDPRLLPDGSRWVDAEALRLVCLHVAGVSA